MGREQNVNWKLTSEFISQQSLANTVILISRDSSKVVLKRKDRVFFKYLFNVNGLGSPKMTFSAGMWSFRGKAAWVTGYIKVRVQWMDYCRLCEQARYLHSSAHCWGFSPPFNYIKAAGTTGLLGSPDYLDCSVIISNQLLLLIFKLLYNVLELPFCSEPLLAALLFQRGDGRLKLCYDLKWKQHAVASNSSVRGLYFICIYASRKNGFGKTLVHKLNIFN